MSLVTHLGRLLAGAAGEAKEDQGQQQNKLSSPDESKHLGAEVAGGEVLLGLDVAGGGERSGNGPEKDGNGVGGNGKRRAESRAQREKRDKESDDGEKERNQVEGPGEPGEVVVSVGVDKGVRDSVLGSKVSNRVKGEVGLVRGTVCVLAVLDATVVVRGPSGDGRGALDGRGVSLEPVEVVQGGRVSGSSEEHKEGEQGRACNEQDAEGANEGSENHGVDVCVVGWV